MNKLLLFLLLIPTLSFGQLDSSQKEYNQLMMVTIENLVKVIDNDYDKWYKFTWNDVGVIVAQSIDGGFDAWNQMVEHHHWGRGRPFWDINTSFKRKYRDYDNGDYSSAYLFSKSLFVAGTDGFHLTRGIKRFGTLATIGIVAGDFKNIPKKDRWKYIGKKLVLSIIANRTTFLIVYK